MFGALNTRNLCHDLGSKLAGVEMAPMSLSSIITGAAAPTARAGQCGALIALH